MSEIYTVRDARGAEQPLLVSVPHAGTAFPAELREVFKPDFVRQPVDTDWFVDTLYDFAPDMGMKLVSARLSRYVVDLNRNPGGAALYGDGRIITDVLPTTSFAGEELYRGEPPDATERERRLNNYFTPYHDFLAAELRRLRAKFKHVLLWDCHSIKHFVPTIRPEAFPDLILGDADGTSAAHSLSATALELLRRDADFPVAHNTPFKGGYITRSFGRPDEGVHALQLEMTQHMYMNETTTRYDEARAEQMRMRLRSVFKALTNVLKELP